MAQETEDTRYDASNSVRLCERCEQEMGAGVADEGDRACGSCGNSDAPHIYVPLAALPAPDEGQEPNSRARMLGYQEGYRAGHLEGMHYTAASSPPSSREGQTDEGEVERAARALNLEAGRQRGLTLEDDWEQITEDERGGWRLCARAALEAVRGSAAGSHD